MAQYKHIEGYITFSFWKHRQTWMVNTITMCGLITVVVMSLVIVCLTTLLQLGCHIYPTDTVFLYRLLLNLNSSHQSKVKTTLMTVFLYHSFVVAGSIM